MLLIVEIFISFGLNFTICEIGQRVSGAFDEVGDAIDELNWYMLPNELQKILPTILINAQQPATLECFGSISCARETFKGASIVVGSFLFRHSRCSSIDECFSSFFLFRSVIPDIRTLWFVANIYKMK